MKVDYAKVMQSIAEGKKNVEIAAEVGCSTSAISQIRRGFVKGKYTPASNIERFKKSLEKAIFVGPNGCWLLTTSIRKNGYAVRSFNGVSMDAHRASYLAYNGEIPKGVHVLHSCDVHNCANPGHLFLGSRVDNMQDCLTKGRFSVGEKHYAAVLTEDLVRSARKEYKSGDSWERLAKKYGVSRGVIRPAILGKTWKHVI